LIEISTDNTQKAAQVVRQTLDAWKVAIFADSLHLNLENPDQELPKIQQQLQQAGVQLNSQRQIPFLLKTHLSALCKEQAETTHEKVLAQCKKELNQFVRTSSLWSSLCSSISQSHVIWLWCQAGNQTYTTRCAKL